MVLIGLLYKSFIENLSNFPSQIIHVSKQEVLNIESISFEYDFSAIELTNSTIDLSRLLLLSKLIESVNFKNMFYYTHLEINTFRNKCKR